MVIDIRCEELKNNTLVSLPDYFKRGWLGGSILKKAYRNMKEYRNSSGVLREMLDNGVVSEEDYLLAAEQVFLYGKAGRKLWIECVKSYILFKMSRKESEDSSPMFIEKVDTTEGEQFSNEQPEIPDSDSASEEIVVEEKETLISHAKKFDKDHIWMFDAGHNGRRDFRGNPKYLFIYINKYRPDICAYWYCEADAVNVIEQVHSLGYYGVLQGSDEANYALARTGVVVSEQLREFLPVTLLNAKYLNLWHGIGFKRVERARTLDNDDLRVGISKKYISYNSYLINNQLLVVNSPTYEKEFIEDFGIDSKHVIRTGYLRCLYQKNYEPISTYNHDVRGLKNLSSVTRLAVYAPTFRAQRGNAFSTAMKDIEELYRCCEENQILLIFKVHPHIEKEPGFLNAWKQYGNRPYFFFWDNTNDFYEIMDQIDLVIYDYSSMFSDFLCAGVKNFIRYIYDEDEYMADGFTQGKEAYYDRTCGIVCHTFEELIDAITHYEDVDDSEEIEKTYQKLWAYTGEDDFEKTIQAVMDFTPAKTKYPTLYSFDVFDTLISRKGLHPYSIFYAVKERMKDNGTYPIDLIERYPSIRHSAEMNVREYYRKTTQVRHSEKVEIQMYEIFERIAEVYGLSEKQSKQLMDWEIEEEIDSVVALEQQINVVKQHIQEGDTVILISDMYLPKNVIQIMLRKADPMLAELPLFVSSEYGVQKTSRLLYFEAYRSFKPFYSFGKWIHYGDNPAADKMPARRLGINTVLIHKPEFNEVEQNLVDTLGNCDAYLIAAMSARLREQMQSLYLKADFTIDIVGLTLIPYVDWVIRDALAKGFERLYFIARDGYTLKMIADALIRENHWPIETRYLYASRRTWRIQSYFDEIDETFWIEQGGNFNDICSKEELLKALYIDEEKFKELLPQIDLESVDWTQKQPGRKLAPIIQKSEEYKKYLLQVAAEKRILSCEYLEQEFDENKKFACVEYWGRGYNQECMTRLWNYITGREEETFYYYARSIIPTKDLCVRYNMTDADVNIAVMEAIFANMPYNSIEEYEKKDGVIKPLIQYTDIYDQSLFNAMEHILPQMAELYAKLGLSNFQNVSRQLFDFALNYVQNNKTSRLIADNIGSLYDNMSMYGERHEYARAYRQGDLKDFLNGIPRGKNTLSIQMSYARSSNRFKIEYDELYQIEQGDDPAKGLILNKNEIMTNRNFKKRYEDALERADRAAILYDEACRSYPVYKKICVVSSTKEFDNDTLMILSNRLRNQQKICVEWLTSDRKPDSDAELMKLLSMAKIIIVDGNIIQLLKVKIRKETTCISLLDRGFRLYHFGKLENIKLKWQYRYDALMHRRISDVIEHTSKDCMELTGFDMDLENVHKLSGACVTDVLFDINYKNRALEKVWSIMPETKNKKIIVYMPQPRKRRNSGAWMEIIDLEQLERLIGNQYCILVDLRSNNAFANSCNNIIDIAGFSKNVSKEKISLRSLLVAADIIIGDYRDTFFESVLLNKPVFSTAVDMYDVQSSSLNMVYDLANINPFPIVETSEELAERLAKVEEYDYQPLEEFRNRYLKGCDGKASERLIESII